MTRIAFIGTGIMGTPMAIHLANGGHDVTVYNRTLEKAKSLGDKVKVATTIEQAVKFAEIVFSIVGYPKDVQQVYEEVFKFATPGTICVDMTTSSPSLAINLAEKASSLGFEMADAPVTGGDIGARNASLSIMVGASPKVFEIIKPYLELLGKTITYMGKPGNGQHAKLANQIAIAGALAGVTESLIYAKKQDLDLSFMLKVLTGGSANSWQAQNNGPKMIQGDYRPGFYIKHFLKDLKLALEEKGLLSLPILEKVTSIYDALSELGKADLGTQTLIEYYLIDLQKKQKT